MGIFKTILDEDDDPLTEKSQYYQGLVKDKNGYMAMKFLDNSGKEKRPIKFSKELIKLNSPILDRLMILANELIKQMAKK